MLCKIIIAIKIYEKYRKYDKILKYNGKYREIRFL